MDSFFKLDKQKHVADEIHDDGHQVDQKLRNGKNWSIEATNARSSQANRNRFRGKLIKETRNYACKFGKKNQDNFQVFWMNASIKTTFITRQFLTFLLF